MIKNEIEIWKSHPDIPGVEISTFGNVRTLDRSVSSEKMTQFFKGRILKPASDRDGYLQASIKVDGKWTEKKVHRLVAQTFISNPHGFPMVNHKDCDRKNNNVENLEWCDNSYNQKYREKFGVPQTEAAGHPLFAINLKTLEVLHFSSQSEAGRALGVYRQNIIAVIKGKRSCSGGFWFTNDDNNANDVIKRKLHDI